MRRLFGTDGVRGIANLDLTPELAFRLGFVGTRKIVGGKGRGRIILGRDPRPSGDLLEAAIISGVCSAGVDIHKAGIIPTPAIAFLTRREGFDAGIVISASHNPVEDNGIKFFSREGLKLSDELEEAVEEELQLDQPFLDRPLGVRVGRCYDKSDAGELYIDHLLSTVSVNLGDFQLALDCANGSASSVAPLVFSRLGAQVLAINTDLKGDRINLECGSTYPGAIQELVRSSRVNLGLSFDGDGDRVIAVDDEGNILDGDHILAVLVCHLRHKNLFHHPLVVVTEMTNIGFDMAMERVGVKVIRTRVGDRYVLEEMIRRGAFLGGEQSGHIIFLDHGTTGDGILTALQLLQVIKESQQPLSELKKVMEKLPQRLANVRVKDKRGVISSLGFLERLELYNRKLKGRGRVLARLSGTESVVRIMVESEDEEETARITDELAQLAKDLDRGQEK